MELVPAQLEGLDGSGQAICTLFLEPQAGWLLQSGGPHATSAIDGNDRFRSAAPPKGDHRSAAGLGFDRHDAEIFFPGKKQGPATTQMIANDSVGIFKLAICG